MCVEDILETAHVEGSPEIPSRNQRRTAKGTGGSKSDYVRRGRDTVRLRWE
ncbi:hypothetical protein DPMN_177866 [Dreissena polymorpha]|uniref:Uncharacterized protein n=1 Tax=Dreissena polymorpha TaxID=45954 RepID=A0A9D4ED05_DREPO|nr:hypothetical protein DPMN_177866 [Dreissena polymorpha]